MALQFHRIPLLRDRHTHPLLYAAFLDGIALGGEPDETREQAVARIRADTRGPGWTIAYGWNSGRYSLTKADFDGLPPLVVFDLSLHGFLVNDAGRALLMHSDPAAADHLEDQEWIERNLLRVLNGFAADGATPDRLRRFFCRLLEVYGVHYAEEMLLVSGEEIRLFEEAGLSDSTAFWAAPELYDRLAAPLREKVYGIKLFTDGALGTRTAALHQEYRGSSNRGLLLYDRSDLEALVAKYLAAGTPIALHAIGDRAIDQVVAAVGEAAATAQTDTTTATPAEPPAGGLVRIEHAQFITEATARRAKALGIRLCMQPNFSQDSVDYADRLPEGYAQRNNPFRMLIDGVGYVPGADLVFGSDGMPHGVGEGLRLSLFPAHAGQTLTLEEFAAGYCLPDESHGHIELQIDAQGRRVTFRVVGVSRAAVGNERTPEGVR